MMYSTNAEMKEFHSFVNSTVRECVTVGGIAPSHESMSSTNMTEISTEGLINWVKDKLKKIFTKFVVIVNKIAARFSKNRQQLLKNIEIYKKNPKAKVKLPVSPKTIKRVTVTLAAVAAATTAILVCKNRNGGKKKIQEIHERADEQLNAVNKEVGEEKKEGVEVSAQEAANASQELANSIEKSENTLKQSANKASHTTPQGKTPEEVKAETQTTGAGVNAASDLNHKASILAKNAAAKDAKNIQKYMDKHGSPDKIKEQEKEQQEETDKYNEWKNRVAEIKQTIEKNDAECEERQKEIQSRGPQSKAETVKWKLTKSKQLKDLFNEFQAVGDKNLEKKNQLLRELDSLQRSAPKTPESRNVIERIKDQAQASAKSERNRRERAVRMYIEDRNSKENGVRETIMKEQDQVERLYNSVTDGIDELKRMGKEESNLTAGSLYFKYKDSLPADAYQLRKQFHAATTNSELNSCKRKMKDVLQKVTDALREAKQKTGEKSDATKEKSDASSNKPQEKTESPKRTLEDLRSFYANRIHVPTIRNTVRLDKTEKDIPNAKEIAQKTNDQLDDISKQIRKLYDDSLAKVRNSSNEEQMKTIENHYSKQLEQFDAKSKEIKDAFNKRIDNLAKEYKSSPSGKEKELSDKRHDAERVSEMSISINEMKPMKGERKYPEIMKIIENFNKTVHAPKTKQLENLQASFKKSISSAKTADELDNLIRQYRKNAGSIKDDYDKEMNKAGDKIDAIMEKNKNN